MMRGILATLFLTLSSISRNFITELVPSLLPALSETKGSEQALSVTKDLHLCSFDKPLTQHLPH